MQGDTNSTWISLRDKFGLPESLVDAIIADFEALDATKPGHDRTETEQRLADAPLDLAALSAHLQDKYEINRRAAGELSSIFSHKAGSQIGVERQLSLGVVKGKWRFTPGAPQMVCDHASLDNSEFDLRKGLRFGGQYILPGREPGCRCFVQPVIPGFDDQRRGLLSRLIRWLLGQR